MRMRAFPILLLFLTGCSGAWLEPIAAGDPLPPGSVYGSIGDFLAAKGCRQAVSLVGPSLMRTYTFWDPGVSLQGGAGFAPSFAARYGIAFSDRRSPIEVETLSEAFNALDAYLTIPGNAAALGLPAGYRITEQDKADLFYVAAGRGLAFRELILPLIAPAGLPPPPAEPPICPPHPQPPPCPSAKDCPACPEATPLPCAPVPCAPVPCTPIPLQLSAKGRATLEAMLTWRTIGPGRRQMLRELAAELEALGAEP